MRINNVDSKNNKSFGMKVVFDEPAKKQFMRLLVKMQEEEMATDYWRNLAFNNIITTIEKTNSKIDSIFIDCIKRYRILKGKTPKELIKNYESEELNLDLSSNFVYSTNISAKVQGKSDKNLFGLKNIQTKDYSNKKLFTEIIDFSKNSETLITGAIRDLASKKIKLEANSMSSKTGIIT